MHAYLGASPPDGGGDFASRFLFDQLGRKEVSAQDVWRNAMALPELERALQPPFASRPWRNTPEFRVMPLAVGGG